MERTSGCKSHYMVPQGACSSSSLGALQMQPSTNPRGGGGATTGPAATPPPSISQNSGGGGGGGGGDFWGAPQGA